MFFFRIYKKETYNFYSELIAKHNLNFLYLKKKNIKIFLCSLANTLSQIDYQEQEQFCVEYFYTKFYQNYSIEIESIKEELHIVNVYELHSQIRTYKIITFFNILIIAGILVYYKLKSGFQRLSKKFS